jgi:hypothetical protein
MMQNISLSVLRLLSNKKKVQVQSPPNFQGSLCVAQDLLLLLKATYTETYIQNNMTAYAKTVSSTSESMYMKTSQSSTL